MTSVSNLPVDTEGHVEMELPWYVNGTLAQDESERLESHLDACAR